MQNNAPAHGPWPYLPHTGPASNGRPHFPQTPTLFASCQSGRSQAWFQSASAAGSFSHQSRTACSPIHTGDSRTPDAPALRSALLPASPHLQRSHPAFLSCTAAASAALHNRSYAHPMPFKISSHFSCAKPAITAPSPVWGQKARADRPAPAPGATSFCQYRLRSPSGCRSPRRPGGTG